MIDLANQLIETRGGPDDLEAQLSVQPMKIESAKASLKSAELTRQAAAIAVTEFEKGALIQEDASTDQELKLARRDIERLKRRIPQSNNPRLQIERAAKGANVNVAPLVIAELEEKIAGFVAESADAKRKVFLEYTKPHQLKALQSEVEKTRSDELAKRATWEIEQSKLKRLQQLIQARELAAGARKAPNPHERQAVVALDRAISIEALLRAKLEEVARNGKPAQRLGQEALDLTTRLRALVDQADFERSESQFDAFKLRFGSGANLIEPTTEVHAGAGLRAGPTRLAADEADPTAFAEDMRWNLKNHQERIISLAHQLTKPVDPTGTLQDQLISQQIDARSAAANFENAKLTREVAEIAVVEYNEGIFPHDKSTLEKERTVAQHDVARKRDLLELAKLMASEVKPSPHGSPSEKAKQSTLADHLEIQEIELCRSELALANSESKLKVLEEYTKARRLDDLRSEVEKARADELAKRVEWELKEAKVKSLQAAVSASRLPTAERQARDAQNRRTRDALGRAISLAKKLETKLEPLMNNQKPDEPLRAEIQDLSNQLQALLDEAEAERSAAQFDAIKARIHSAAERK